MGQVNKLKLARDTIKIMPKLNPHQHISGSIVPFDMLYFIITNCDVRKNFIEHVGNNLLFKSDVNMCLACILNVNHNSLVNIITSTNEHCVMETLLKWDELDKALCSIRKYIRYIPTSNKGDFLGYNNCLSVGKSILKSKGGINILQLLVYNSIIKQYKEDNVVGFVLRSFGVRPKGHFNVKKTSQAILIGLQKVENEMRQDSNSDLPCTAWLAALDRNTNMGVLKEIVTALINTKKQLPVELSKRFIGIDIVGCEYNYKPGKFNDIIDMAKYNGLMVFEHVGESWLPGNLILALERTLLVVREHLPFSIAQSIALLVDPSSLHHYYSRGIINTIIGLQDIIITILKEENILVELCPTSNLLLSRYVRGKENCCFRPFIWLRRKGVRVLIGTDNTEVLGVKSLTDEYMKLLPEASVEELKGIASDSLSMIIG